MKPPGDGFFNDAYIVYELMDTDLHQVIRSSQPLSGAPRHSLLRCRLYRAARCAERCDVWGYLADDHILYFLYQARGNSVAFPHRAAC